MRQLHEIDCSLPLRSMFFDSIEIFRRLLPDAEGPKTGKTGAMSFALHSLAKYLKATNLKQEHHALPDVQLLVNTLCAALDKNGSVSMTDEPQEKVQAAAAFLSKILSGDVPDRKNAAYFASSKKAELVSLAKSWRVSHSGNIAQLTAAITQAQVLYYGAEVVM
jgi:DNA polymerase III epsilon subunit-like protein